MVARDDSDNETEAIGTDEHGDPFKDYGFLSRVEDHKKAGNADFARGGYGEALAEYDAALLLLVTVAEDRSITLGQRKWDQVVVLRSLLNLNKSACYCKLGMWREAVAEASTCLLGNIPTETKFTHAHILANVKPSSMPEVDRRITAAMRAKAWFRMSEGYSHLGYFARAQHASARALKACEDEKLRALLTSHSKRVAALAKREQRQQRQRFHGFWDKLEQQQGGYVKRDLSRQGQTKSEWEGLGAEEKLQRMSALDGSDGDSDSEFEGFAEGGGAAPALGWEGPEPIGGQADGLQQTWQMRREEERLRARARATRRAPAPASRPGHSGVKSES